VRLPYPKERRERVIVIAQRAELRDDAQVVGHVTRGRSLPVESSEANRYQVWCKGRGVWINRADVLPLDRAMDYFTEEIRQNPIAADYAVRGWLRGGVGDLDGAMTDYDQAIRLEPKLESAYRCRGLVWRAKGEFDKAMADCDTAVRLDPKSAFAYAVRGILFTDKGESEKAIADFGIAIDLDPSDSMAFYNRGVVWKAHGDDLEKAILDYSAAIRLDSKLLAAYANRGYAYRIKGDLDLAMADYDEAIRIYPKYTAAFGNRGLIWMAKGNYDQALADFDEAIRIDPMDVLGNSNRGFVLFKKGEFDKALAACDEAIRLHPNYAYTYRHRATLRATCPDQRFRDGPKAVEDAKTAHKMKCWSVDILAVAYAELGEFKTAIRLQTVAIKYAPETEKKGWQDRLELYQAGKPYREVPT